MRRLKELRNRDGISQRDLAKELGISYSAVQRFEFDKDNNPRWDTVLLLARHFGVSTDYLMGVDTNTIAAHSENGVFDERAALEVKDFLRWLFATIAILCKPL